MITIEPNDPFDLVYLQQPRNTVTNNTIEPPVEVQLVDEFGNVVPQDGIEVNISEEDYWQNNITLQVATNTNGVAIFDDLQIAPNADQGDVTFNATFDGINAPKTSRVFSIIDGEDFARFEITDLAVTKSPIKKPENRSIFSLGR